MNVDELKVDELANVWNQRTKLKRAGLWESAE